MNGFGVILMVLGVAFGLYGLGAGATAPGGTTLNFGLLIDKVLVTMIGSGVFAGGCALLTGGVLRDAINRLEKVREPSPLPLAVAPINQQGRLIENSKEQSGSINFQTDQSRLSEESHRLLKLAQELGFEI